MNATTHSIATVDQLAAEAIYAADAAYSVEGMEAWFAETKRVLIINLYNNGMDASDADIHAAVCLACNYTSTRGNT